MRGTAKLLIGYLNGTLKALIDSQMSVVDIDDRAEGHRGDERRPGRAVHPVGATLTVREAVELMGSVAGITDPPRHPGPGRDRAGVGDRDRRIRRRRAPLCTEMMRTLLHGHAYGSRDRDLAYTPIETLRRTYDWYVANGHVRPRDGARPRQESEPGLASRAGDAADVKPL